MLHLPAEYSLKLHNQERALLMRDNLSAQSMGVAIGRGYYALAVDVLARLQARFRLAGSTTAQRAPAASTPACC